MLSEYISAVENKKVIAPRIDTFYKAHLYCSVEDVYSRAKEFHLPDEVCSMALAWHLVQKRAVAADPYTVRSLDGSNLMAEAVKHNTKSERERKGWMGEVVNKTQVAEQEFTLMV
jgi:ribulose 1,5-bisphosphate synthetase/thiazole synthase